MPLKIQAQHAFNYNSYVGLIYLNNMILHKRPMLYRIFLYICEQILNLLFAFHSHADIIATFLSSLFLSNFLMAPINHYEKIVNMGYALTTALIVAVVKVIWPNGLTQIVNKLKRVRMKIFFLNHILPKKKKGKKR